MTIYVNTGQVPAAVASGAALGTTALQQAALGVASGAAKVGSDGYVGGTAGTPLAPAVVTGTSTAANKRPVAAGVGAAVTFEPVTEYDLRMDFGAAVDGTTSDDTAWSSAITALGTLGGARLKVPCTNPSGGLAPSKITTPIVVPAHWGLEIVGHGKQGSVISQATDNVPIINMGGTGSDPFHSWKVADLGFTYANSQPSTNTSAIPILFSAMGFASQLRNLWFQRGFYAIQVASGINCPWGTSWDDLCFNNGLTGGAIDMSLGSTGGAPNNKWGRMYVLANTMVGPIFKSLRGNSWVVDAIEINNANLGPQLMTLAGGSEVTIGAFKLEVGAYGAAANGMVLIECTGSLVKISQLKVVNGSAGDQVTVNIPSGKMFLLHNSQFLGGQVGKTDIDFINAQFNTTAGNVYCLGNGQVATNGYQEVGTAIMVGCSLFDTGASGSGELIKVRDWNNDHMTQDLGDANYTATLGSQNIACFNTAFTAQRTITLPAVPANLPNGLYYEFVFSPGTLTSFGALIVCNGVTIGTVASQATGMILRYTARRSTVTVQAGWRCTKYQPAIPTGFQV